MCEQTNAYQRKPTMAFEARWLLAQADDSQREARSDEVVEMRREIRDLKEVVADLTLENRVLKKSVIADGDDDI